MADHEKIVNEMKDARVDSSKVGKSLSEALKNQRKAERDADQEDTD